MKTFSFEQPLGFDIRAKDEATAIALAGEISAQVAKFLNDLQAGYQADYQARLLSEYTWFTLGTREIVGTEDADDEE